VLPLSAARHRLDVHRADGDQNWRHRGVPTYGLMAATIGLVAIAFLAPVMSPTQLAWSFCVIALFMGTVMGVVQVTVQAVSGPRLLGTGRPTRLIAKPLLSRRWWDDNSIRV
jgi:hypothetical protein